jgi:predicted transcriptional regulator
MDTDQNECGICVEKYNKSSRVKVACPYCEYSACRKCCETWILGESAPICISPACGKEWTRKHLTTSFTKTFVTNDYKKHRENLLFDQERALLPATQPIVENQIRCEKISSEIERIETEELSEIYKRMSRLRTQLSQLRQSNVQSNGERSTFIKACSDSNCRGFLSSQWKCGICEKWACSNCHEIKGMSRDSEHVCNPDNVATAALLASDTKSCPTCGNGIYKIEGCDQMFCTMCHTAFSWRTGRIETNIHNPHYYDWLRRTGGNVPRNDNDIQCGRDITNTFARQTSSLLRANGASAETIRKSMTICESMVHMRLIDLPRYEADRVLNNQELRVDYLRQKISEDDFKVQIQRLDKKHQKKREMYNVLTMLINTVTDIMYRFNNAIGRLSESQVNDILSETDEITLYANECLADIATTYNSKRMIINDSMRLRPR